MRALTLCLLVLATPALAADAAPAAFPWERKLTTLDNGLRVVVVKTHAPGMFALYGVVGVGSRDEVEPGHSGFAHFFEHMMFKGNARYTLLMGLVDADSIAGTLAWYSGPWMDVAALDRVLDEMSRATPGDLAAFVKAYFGKDQRAVVTLAHQPKDGAK